MAKLRRSGSRNWAKGFFAFFSILLAGASALYLFNLMTNPDAFGSQTAGVNTALPETAGQPPAPAATASLPAAAAKPDPGLEKKLTELSAAVAAMTRHVSDLDRRLQPIEKFVGPVAALPPATSVTTSPPPTPTDLALPEPPPPPAPEQQQAAPEPPPPPPEPAPAPAAAEPQPEPEPMAAEPMPEPEPMEQAAAPLDAVPEPAQEPAALAAPLDPDPTDSEDDAGSAAEALAPAAPSTDPAPAPAAAAAAPPAPAAPIESAALDPVALPDTANDGTTRYGIELGVVAKQDGLRPLWREFLTNHAALVAGLQPRRVLAPDKKWRLIAGPFTNAEEAAQACALFKKVSRPCEATVYAGDRL